MPSGCAGVATAAAGDAAAAEAAGGTARGGWASPGVLESAGSRSSRAGAGLISRRLRSGPVGSGAVRWRGGAGSAVAGECWSAGERWIAGADAPEVMAALAPVPSNVGGDGVVASLASRSAPRVSPWRRDGFGGWTSPIDSPAARRARLRRKLIRRLPPRPPPRGGPGSGGAGADSSPGSRSGSSDSGTPAGGARSRAAACRRAAPGTGSRRCRRPS